MKVKPILQSILEEVSFENLPTPWNSIDVVSFSQRKSLWNFQQEALKNAIKVLYLYFKEDKANKSKFYQRYRIYGLDREIEKFLDIRLSKVKRKMSEILQNYYSVDSEIIRFENFINRATFWMATGSGKTLIIVKLVEILKNLMDSNEIPKKDILILTHRDDLILQLKKHVEEFNELAIERGFKIKLVSLKEYDKVKRESLIPFFNEITVFYYRSDLISDEEKEKIVDFRNYENGGNWYIILDEAHKGDKEESKRQLIFSIMSRNGFLFNFSATFTDVRDIITVAYNFNLERFVSEGYGKHICILRQEVRAFRENEDYNSEEKQKIVLKALILLTVLKKRREKIKNLIQKDIYHEPLLLTLVNTVNFSEIKEYKPDLVMFFEEIEKIAKGYINENVLEESKKELLEEFREKPPAVFEEDFNIEINEEEIEKITLSDILNYVFNSESFGNIEAILIPGKREEAILKLKTSDKPFALIKIGDAVRWIRENLSGYEVIESYEDKSIFENLDEREDISILMGSRAFYEGWDSNRPNVILFINIGVKEDAKKFVIQSIGRGVRIEPIKGKRGRMLFLYKRKVDEGLYEKIKDYVDVIETLFVFGTKREVLSKIIETLREEKGLEEKIELVKNKEAEDKLLLIPVFRQSNKKLYEERNPQKFAITEKQFELLGIYLNSLDDRILLVKYDIYPDLLKFIKNSVIEKNSYYKFVEKSYDLPIELLVRNIISHFSLSSEELERFKKLEDEIIHFKNIKVVLEDSEKINELKQKIDKILEFKNAKSKEFELLQKMKSGAISDEEFYRLINEIKSTRDEESFKDLKIKYVANHYYLPVILSEKEKIDYIKHIIRVKSEVEFIKKLESFIKTKGNSINVDWWLFSKIDETLDEIFIPYYDPESNKFRKFKPDFIFWISKGNDYFIVFVDPKGISHTEFEHKVDWFRKFFEDNGKPKIFYYGENEKLRIRVFLLLYTQDVNKLPEGYRRYWFDNPEAIFKLINI